MDRLVDQWGRPISAAALRREEAVPDGGWVRSIVSGHPSRGLEPERLARLLIQAERGDARGYLELAEEMEEKDLHYLSVLGTRRRAVAQIEPTVEAASESADDVAAAELVREFLRRDTLQAELFDMLDAIGKGYSVTEIIWDTEGSRWWPARLEWRDPRWFQFDRVDGRTLRLLSPDGTRDLFPGKYIVHQTTAKSGLPIRGGIARSVAWCFMFKSFSLKDWAVFLETYGQPLRLGRYHSGATSAEREILLRAVSEIGADAAAIIPDSMQVEFITTQGAKGTDQYERHADWLDRQVSKAVLGQTLTTEVQGGSLAAAKVHDGVRMDIMAADARALAATLNRDLIRPFVAFNLGPRQRYPRLLLSLPDSTDLRAFAAAVGTMVDRGMEVEASVLRDRFGLPEPAPGARLLRAANAGDPRLPGSPRNHPPPGDPGLPGPAEAGQDGRLARQAEQVAAAARDGIDELVDEMLADWRPLMAPVLGPVQHALGEAGSLEEFADRLLAVAGEMDVQALARQLGDAAFQLQLMGALGVPISEEERTARAAVGDGEPTG